MTRGSSRLVWDGERLATELHAPGRRFRADPACFGAEPVEDAWAHVCALTGDDAKLPFDFPEIQQARRDALAMVDPAARRLPRVSDHPRRRLGQLRRRGHGRARPLLLRRRPVCPDLPRHCRAHQSVLLGPTAGRPGDRALQRSRVARRLVPQFGWVEVSRDDGAAASRGRFEIVQTGDPRRARVRAYKVLIDGRSGFTGWRWPLPTGDEPGEWVSATGPLELCVNGVHACTVEQLAQWIGEELWTIELGGEILEAEAALVAARGRLLGRVAAWDQAAREEVRTSVRPARERVGCGRDELERAAAGGDQPVRGGRARRAGRLLGSGPRGRASSRDVDPGRTTTQRSRASEQPRRPGSSRSSALRTEGRRSRTIDVPAQECSPRSARNASTSDSMTGSGTSSSRSSPVVWITARIWSR